jgi:hypothetical protein
VPGAPRAAWRWLVGTGARRAAGRTALSEAERQFAVAKTQREAGGTAQFEVERELALTATQIEVERTAQYEICPGAPSS